MGAIVPPQFYRTLCSDYLYTELLHVLQRNQALRAGSEIVPPTIGSFFPFDAVGNFIPRSTAFQSKKCNMLDKQTTAKFRRDSLNKRVPPPLFQPRGSVLWQGYAMN